MATTYGPDRASERYDLGEQYQRMKEDHQSERPSVSHYLKGGIEPIDFILSNDIPFCEGNVIKYVFRWREKGGVKDLQKARDYIDFLIADNAKA